MLDAATLVPISHWTPPSTAPRRYATWFFVGVLPEDAADVIVDGARSATTCGPRPRRRWRAPEGEIELVPPTWVTLQRLAEAGEGGDGASRGRGRRRR